MARPQPLCHICTPVGMLGYGFEEETFRSRLEELVATGVPTAVVLDSGSTDSGPSKLALGTKTCPDENYKKDLTKLMKAVIDLHAPFLVSSVGGSGADEHVDDFRSMIREISEEFKSPRNLEVLAIYSEISKEIVRDKLNEGLVTGCGCAVPELTTEALEQTPRVLAQMGPGPLLEAMAAHRDFDIVLAGRAYDPAPYVAFCIWQRMQSLGIILQESDVPAAILGGFYHMGKIMECGGLCAVPKSRGAQATVYEDGTFDVSPLDTTAKCTPLSVAAHTLYEKSRPDILHGPGGFLDLRNTAYETLKDRPETVHVSGAHFEYAADPLHPWTVKLEGARVIGYRTMFMGSFHDPILLTQLDNYLAAGKARIQKENGRDNRKWKLDFHIHGLDNDAPKEAFVVGEVLAETQQLATAIASSARVYCAHGSYPGQMATGGNFAFGVGGVMELPVGPCCEFSVYHLMTLAPGEQSGQAISDEAQYPVSRSQAARGLFAWRAETLEKSAISSNGSMHSSLKTSNEPNGTGTKLPTKNANGILTPKCRHVRTLRDIAKVIRSKNAGPYELTLDVLFDSPAVYQAVKKSELLDGKGVASLFGRDISDIVWCGFFDQALAWKATFPRRRGAELIASGGYMENDVQGSQQYVPLMQLPLSDDLISEIMRLES